MAKAGSIVAWVIVGFVGLLLVGALLSGGFLSAVLIAVAMTAICPPVVRTIGEKQPALASRPLRFGVFAVGIIAGLALIPVDQSGEAAPEQADAGAQVQVQSNDEEVPQANTPPVADAAPVTDFGGVYSGTIGGSYEIEMILDVDRDEGTVSGHYFYLSKQQPISLSGTVGANRNLTMMETVDGQVTGTFQVLVDGTTVKGNWSSPDGNRTLAVSLARRDESDGQAAQRPTPPPTPSPSGDAPRVAGTWVHRWTMSLGTMQVDNVFTLDLYSNGTALLEMRAAKARTIRGKWEQEGSSVTVAVDAGGGPVSVGFTLRNDRLCLDGQGFGPGETGCYSRAN